MTPVRPLISNLIKDNKSLSEPIPPDAITGFDVLSNISPIKSSLGPESVPSVSMSVTINSAIGKEENVFIRSIILLLLLSLVYDQFFFKLIFFTLFFLINLTFIFIYHFGKSNKLNLSLIKKVEII